MDKQEYWTNRKAGRRGQGPQPSLVLAVDTKPATSLRGLKRLGDSKHQSALAIKADHKKRRIGHYATARDIQARVLILRERRKHGSND